MKGKTEQQPTARTRHSRPAVQNVSDTVILQSNWPPLFFFSPFSASAQVSAHLSRIHHTGEEGGDTFFAPFSYLASLGQKIVIGLGKRVCNIASSGVFQSISTCFATKVVRGLVNFARKKNWDILARAASMYIRFVFLFHDSPSKAAVLLVWLLVVGLALV